MSDIDHRPRLQKDAASPAFWRNTSLAGMDRDQWEALCDGCGQCCLEKLQDPASGAVTYTNVACRFLDIATCRCRCYADHRSKVRGCERLTADNILAFDWLPETCAYRLLAAGRDLPWWHYLISGDRDLVHRVGVSVRGRAIPEHAAGPLEHHLTEPHGRRK